MHDLPDVLRGLVRVAEPVEKLVRIVEPVVYHEKQVVDFFAFYLDSYAWHGGLNAGDYALLCAGAIIQLRVSGVELAALLRSVARHHVHFHAGLPPVAESEGVDFRDKIGVSVLDLLFVRPEYFLLEKRRGAVAVLCGEAECHFNFVLVVIKLIFNSKKVKFSLLITVVIAAILPVRYVLGGAVVIQMAALAEGCQVGWFVVGAVAVEVGDGEDDSDETI